MTFCSTQQEVCMGLSRTNSLGTTELSPLPISGTTVPLSSHEKSASSWKSKESPRWLCLYCTQRAGSEEPHDDDEGIYTFAICFFYSLFLLCVYAMSQ